MSTTLKGTLITLIAGIAWGLSGVSGQYLMVHGFSAIGLTNLRLLFSGIVLIILSCLADKEKFLAFVKDKSSYLPLLNFAFLGLLLTQLFRGDCRIQCWDSHCVTVSLSSGYFGLYLCQG